MGTCYTLVNVTKNEQVAFTNLPFSKGREIAGNPAGAAMVAWYLLRNPGDLIGFVGDDIQSPFPGIGHAELVGFPDRTDEVLAELIQKGVLVDCGVLYMDGEDPGNFCRDIRNAWMPAELLVPPPTGAQPNGPE